MDDHVTHLTTSRHMRYGIEGERVPTLLDLCTLSETGGTHDPTWSHVCEHFMMTVINGLETAWAEDSFHAHFMHMVHGFTSPPCVSQARAARAEVTLGTRVLPCMWHACVQLLVVLCH